MTKCPKCGELVTGDRDRCIGCGRAVPDAARPLEQRLRMLVIGAFVLGALVMIAQMVRESLLRR